MTAPYGRPDALIQTDHGPARVYSARLSGTLDAAIVTDDYELLIPESEIEHLVRAIAPDYDTTDPDEPTADDIAEQAGDAANDLRKLIALAADKACAPEDWDEASIPDLHGILTGLLVSLDDVVADLDNLR
jgi:hypothetical protein